MRLTVGLVCTGDLLMMSHDLFYLTRRAETSLTPTDPCADALSCPSSPPDPQASHTVLNV